MQLTAQRGLILILACFALFVGAATVASAEDDISADTSVSVETAVDVDATVDVKPPLKTRPALFFQNKQLKAFNENAQGVIKDVRRNVLGLPIKELNASTTLKARMEMKTASTSGERKNILENFREKQEARKDERKAKIENFKERIQILARTHLGASINRFGAAIRHFENIAERIESRIDKLNARGIDTASVEASLETAVELTATAQADVAALKALLNSVTDSSDPDTIKAQIRAAIEKATKSIKAAHEAFVKTARELSALVRASAGINSTTTVDVE